MVGKKFEYVKLVQSELETSNGKTIFGVIADLEKLDAKTFEALCFQGSVSFVLASAHKLSLNEESLKEIVSKSIEFSGDFAYVNYASVIANFVKPDSCILRFGGDGGDQEVSVQVFADRSCQSKLELDLLGVSGN